MTEQPTERTNNCMSIPCKEACQYRFQRARRRCGWTCPLLFLALEPSCLAVFLAMVWLSWCRQIGILCAAATYGYLWCLHDTNSARCFRLMTGPSHDGLLHSMQKEKGSCPLLTVLSAMVVCQSKMLGFKNTMISTTHLHIHVGGQCWCAKCSSCLDVASVLFL